MAEVQQPLQGPKQRKRQWRYKVRLKDGQHVEDNHNGETVVYSRGDIFVSAYPLDRRWPEKYEAVAEEVPVTGSGTRIMDDDYDPILDGPAAGSVPTAPMPQLQPEQPRVPQQPARQQQASRRQELLDDKVLNNMTVNELKSLAEEEEIPLAGATKKDEIIDAIKKHR